MALDKELATYHARLPELLQHEGKFALVHDDQVVDVFTSYEDALKRGYHEFGVNSPFLVKQIQQIEQAQYITRTRVA